MNLFHVKPRERVRAKNRGRRFRPKNRKNRQRMKSRRGKRLGFDKEDLEELTNIQDGTNTEETNNPSSWKAKNP